VFAVVKLEKILAVIVKIQAISSVMLFHSKMLLKLQLNLLHISLVNK